MDLEQGTVFFDYYFGLKLNGWPKQEAAKAARRHVNRMRRAELKKEVARILAQRKQ